MATVRSIGQDALIELGVLAPGESMSAAQASTVLTRAINMIDAWQADRLTLSLQLRTVFTLPSGTSSITVGTGEAVNIPRPMWINTVNYLIPGTNPAVEVPIGIMGQDAYANLSIKQLSSAYPIQCFYQTDLADGNGTLIFWPQVSQDVQIALYTPQGVGVPTTLDSVLTGPPGYAEAFTYQLALRLCTPLGVPPPPLLGGMAAQAFAAMKRPNELPGQLGTDAALIPNIGGGYNVLSDQTTASQSR